MNKKDWTIEIDEDTGIVWAPVPVVMAILGVTYASFNGWTKFPEFPQKCPKRKKWNLAEIGTWTRMHQTLLKGQGGFGAPWRPATLVDMSDTLDADGNPIRRIKSQKDLLEEAKLRQTEAAAEKLEIENQVSRQELLLAGDVRTEWGNIMSKVRTRLLQVPYAAAPLVAGEVDQITIQEKIMGLQRDALDEMATGGDSEPVELSKLPQLPKLPRI